MGMGEKENKKGRERKKNRVNEWMSERWRRKEKQRNKEEQGKWIEKKKVKILKIKKKEQKNQVKKIDCLLFSWLQKNACNPSLKLLQRRIDFYIKRKSYTFTKKWAKK